MDTIKNIVASTLLISTIALSSILNAAVLDLSARDYITAGDKLITYDASTNLEWLDLTVTKGNSIIDTESESFFIDGTWRWATIDEYFDLWSDLGLSYPGEGISTRARFNDRGPRLRDMEKTLSLLGVTQIDFYVLNTIGTSRLFQSTANTRNYWLGFAGINYSTSPPDSIIGYESSSIIETTSDSNMGSYLVRTSPVPLTPAVWLFGSGLVGLIGISRRHQGR